MGLNAQVLGISIDHIPCLEAWAESLGDIQYPLLSDFWPHGLVSEKFGVLRTEGYSERAIFVIDKYGFLRYIDIHDIDKQPSNDELRKVMREIDPDASEAEPITAMVEADPLPKGGIILYCTPWCPDCKTARGWLYENNLEFIEVDITSNPRAAKQVMAWAGGNRTTPTFDIDGTIIVDWDKEKLAETLHQKGYLNG